MDHKSSLTIITRKASTSDWMCEGMPGLFKNKQAILITNSELHTALLALGNMAQRILAYVIALNA